MDDDDYDIIRNWVATDDCNNASTVTQTIQVRPEVDEDFVTVNICVLDDPLNLDDLITNTTSLYGEWESDFLDLLDEGLFDPANAEVGVYEFEYTFMDYNCKWTTLIEIVVNDDCANYPCIRSREDVTLSKLVTANNDGFNDFFKVEYTLNELSNDDCDISVDIEFFNRWGAKVFKKNNYENDWSGTSSSGMPGGSGLLPTGTYYYVVTLNKQWPQTYSGLHTINYKLDENTQKHTRPVGFVVDTCAVYFSAITTILTIYVQYHFHQPCLCGIQGDHGGQCIEQKSMGRH